MTYKLACKDVGIECPYIMQGETMDALMTEIEKHAKEVHGFTDEQLKDPKIMNKVKSAIKQE